MDSYLKIKNLIQDVFMYDGAYIVVLNNSALYDDAGNNLLLLARVVATDEGSKLEPLHKEEYDDAFEHYQFLQKAFSSQVEGNEHDE